MINSKNAKKFRQSKQLELWCNLVSDPGPAVKSAMNETIKSCSLSRVEIVDKMNKLASMAGITCNGRTQKITVALFDKWVAPGSKDYHIPLRLLHIFCRAVEDNLPLMVFSSFFEDAYVISNEEHKKLEWAKAELTARVTRKQASKLAQEVGL